MIQDSDDVAGLMASELSDIVRNPSRLAALRRTALLDTPPEEPFDRLTRLAAKVLEVPVALVALLDEDRQFFKSCVGLPEPWASRRERPLAQSFCQYSVALNQPLVIPEALEDPLVKTHPAVAEFGIRAYLGIPLITSDGHGLGTFCVFDTQPRAWTQNQIDVLTGLATAVVAEIELRVAVREAERRTLEAEEAQRQLSFLAQASRILASSLDYAITLKNLVRLVVPQLADWCIVYLAEEDGLINRLAIECADPAKAGIIDEIQNGFRLDPRAAEGVPAVIRSGKAALYPEAPTSVQIADVEDPDALRPIVKQLGILSWMCVPLVAHGRTIGAISFMTAESGRRYSATDLALAEELGHRAGLAIDNALLYRQAQEITHMRAEFLSIASHELKTPLTTVKGYIQFLARYLNRPSLDRDRLLAVVHQLHEQADRFESLISDLLDVSRMQQGRVELRLEPVDLVALARQLVARFEHVADRTPHHRIILDAPPQSIQGRWDARRLDQMLSNLLSNALKYSPDGGDIHLRLRRLKGSVEIVVSDQGIGIPTDEQPQLFQPFFRGDTARKRVGGTGLGLYIAAQIVKQHGGAIAVHSELGMGSTFSVRLPLAPGGNHPAAVPEIAAAEEAAVNP